MVLCGRGKISMKTNEHRFSVTNGTSQKLLAQQVAAIFTSSPGVFNVIATSPDDAEQIEIRGIFLQKNQPFGVYSPIYNTVIQP
jgi:hypothetical protein